MCGIAAVIAASPANLSFVQSMCDLIRHRGPDGEGYTTFDHNLTPMPSGCADTPLAVYTMDAPYAPRRRIKENGDGAAIAALGHRRLAIVDQSPLAHQPMCTYDARYWISYNGEIYNYIALRDELRRAGYQFATQTDTEVILAAFAHWGEACSDRFNGMWAFVILDRRKNTLFLARDRLGVKPLYYWVSPKGLLGVASEIKQFTAMPGWRARLNGQRAYDFLAWYPIDHTDETLFQGVHQLRPGEKAVLHLNAWQQALDANGRIPVSRWYQLPAADYKGDWTAARQQFRLLFEDAVRIRMKSSVAVGYALSGGLDSSSVVCMSARLATGFSPKTFSMCVEDPQLNEQTWVDHVVNQTGAISTCFSPAGDDLFTFLPKLTWDMDEPFGSPAVFAHWLIMRAASQASIKVMLGGSGSDESFAGYDAFHLPILSTLARKGRFEAMTRELRALRAVQGYGKKDIVKLVLLALAPACARKAYRAIRTRQQGKLEWLNVEKLRAVPINPLRENSIAGGLRVGSLSETLLTVCALPMVQHFVDRNSMAHSIEAREPFLDYRLIEFAMGLPDNYKMEQGIQKRIIRDAMVDILPEATRLRRSKIGMGTPNHAWVTHGGMEAFRARMRHAIEVSQGVLTPECMDYAVSVASGQKPFDLAIWRMISFGAWMERFGVHV